MFFMGKFNCLGQLTTAIACFLAIACESPKTIEKSNPNVILIYTDDVGYGDLGCYGGQIPTPSIDRLAQEGLLFTHAYTTAATCTPSRYSMLTGEYAWRAQGRGVAPGDASALIRSGHETWPLVMQRAGYRTAVVGKWHLGLGGDEGPEWNGEITHGPLDIGFDEVFILPSTGDRVPTVFVEGNRVANLDPSDPIHVSYREKVGDRPTGLDHPELLSTMWSHGHNQTIINGISRIGYMAGGESALWRDEDFADTFLEKSLSFIGKSGESPFFLYLATHDVHVPRIAHERFQGVSGFGPRGDVLIQLDWMVGEILDYLDAKGLADNTMVIFSSDNGPVLDDGYVDQAEEMIGDHQPRGGLRGGKYSAFEAGTRVPLLVRWPGQVGQGIRSQALFSQVDFLASFADFLDEDFNQKQALDSESAWETLIGRDTLGREGLVQEAIQGVLSYVSRDGYKYIPAHEGSKMVPWGVNIETGFDQEEQLYNLSVDPYERNNIHTTESEKLEELKARLQRIIQGG